MRKQPASCFLKLVDFISLLSHNGIRRSFLALFWPDRRVVMIIHDRSEISPQGCFCFLFDGYQDQEFENGFQGKRDRQD